MISNIMVEKMTWVDHVRGVTYNGIFDEGLDGPG
jgi:hypothetical protein